MDGFLTDLAQIEALPEKPFTHFGVIVVVGIVYRLKELFVSGRADNIFVQRAPFCGKRVAAAVIR